ncbi:uncharacterized protein LOC128965236 [Oppia nitens]|uniref:uncharacterized protein LOC128965236 n=1 Tax=Oppia nitens TaxID=1686743 RepID=UPI0023DC5433|nr:uncharacterized protein LOC128965236 [Oppia nitens]
MLDHKLLFPLCVNCAKTKSATCICNNRSFTGTWTTEELKLALEKGYTINTIYEVLDYEKDYSKNKFKIYIDMFLKIKQESSGWPEWCTSEDLKQQYIENYYEKEGVKLEYNKIQKNEALRYIAKLMLNSLWGKLAQRPNQNRTSIIKTFNDYWELITNKHIELLGHVFVNEDTIIFTWKYIDDDKDYARNYNVAVASFVTAYARIKLYKIMEEIEIIRPKSLLYHDTDSVIFYRKYTDPIIVCGDYLGDLTDEIIKDYTSNSKCIEFAALGPKNYGFSVQKSDGAIVSLFKCKGITCHFLAKQSISFEKMLNMALNYRDSNENSIIKVPQRQFVINKYNDINTKYYKKEYKVTSDKRYINGVYTFPYGFVCA